MSTTMTAPKTATLARLDRRDEAAFEARLLEGLLRQNPLALEQFYRRYRPLMVSTARKIVTDEWDVEEVVQDVVWTVHRKADSFRGEAGLSTWVYRVTQNAARMLLRKRKRVPTPIESDALDAAVHSLGDGASWHRPDAQADGNAAAARLQEAFEALPADNRALFEAMDLRDEDRDAVAATMCLSISALKARLHRVRKHLRAAMLRGGSLDGVELVADAELAAA